MKKNILLMLLFIVILLSSCSLTPYSRSEFMMDTQCVITVYSRDDLDKLDDVFSSLRDIERMVSRYDEGSDVFRINEAAGVRAVRVSEETFTLIARAKEISLITGGAFNPLLGKISDMWNFTGTEHHIPSQDEMESIIAAAGDMDNLVLDEEKCSVYLASPCLSLDLGGIAKGYASEKAAAMLAGEGVEKAIINLGGNIYAVGSRSSAEGWRIGLQNPDSSEGGYFTVVNASDEAVVTSGSYQRYFMSDGVVYHHILDPSTGYPAQTDLASVSVINSDGTLADALSTALFVMGSADAEAFCMEHGIKAVLLTVDGEISYLGIDGAEG